MSDDRWTGHGRHIVTSRAGRRSRSSAVSDDRDPRMGRLVSALRNRRVRRGNKRSTVVFHVIVPSRLYPFNLGSVSTLGRTNCSVVSHRVAARSRGALIGRALKIGAAPRAFVSNGHINNGSSQSTDVFKRSQA